MALRIGHDAELFAVDSKGNPASVVGLVGGTKEEPSLCKNGALQEDNVMAELNIRPADSRGNFIKYTTDVMDELAKRLDKYSLKPVIQPHMVFSKEALNSQQAEKFGCDPDFNAWEHCQNPIIDLKGENDRYAGGHVHIELPFKDDPAKVMAFIRFLDCTLGAGMIIRHGVSKRYESYGRLGAYRPTAYGVEYRSIDNSWLSSKESMGWVWDVVVAIRSRFISGAPSNTLASNVLLHKLIVNKDISQLKSMYNHHVHPKLKM